MAGVAVPRHLFRRITAAVLFAIAGMALGLHLAISGDHEQHVSHAHIMLAGWISLALMGLFANISRRRMFRSWRGCTNPIEMAFSKLRTPLRTAARRSTEWL
jgi:hypothetical protein